MEQRWKIQESALCRLGILKNSERKDGETPVSRQQFAALTAQVCSTDRVHPLPGGEKISYLEALDLMLAMAGLSSHSASAEKKEEPDPKGTIQNRNILVIGTGFRLGITAYNDRPMEQYLVWRQAVTLLYGLLDIKANPAVPENPELTKSAEEIRNCQDEMKEELGCHNPVIQTVMMEDGVKIRGILWMPLLSDGEQVPLIIEATPYRHMDKNLVNASKQGDYFGSRGFAYMGLDLRGSGASEGVLTDEYTKREHSDIIQVIEWSTEQSWSNGFCGMIGISWSGFTALQVAYRQPEALRAIVTACSTDDRYRDDAHFQGGAILANSMPVWGSSTLSNGVQPPDPCTAPENWRELWNIRMEQSPQFIDTWMNHPTRDEYWKYGSVCEDYSRIKAATLIAGGFSDGYTSPAFRMMKSLTCPKKAIIGPWAHGYGFEAVPGPNIAFLNECARWFEQWLKGIDTGIMAEPDLKVYIQDGRKPEAYHKYENGHWEGFYFPLEQSENMNVLYLSGSSGLSENIKSERISYYSEDMSVGFGSGGWCPFGGPKDWAVDQRMADEKCLSFDSGILESDLTLLGIPKLYLELSTDKKAADIIVRLLDVDGAGPVTLISRGMLDLRSRNGLDRKESIVPGEKMDITIDLKACSYVIPAGHRIRISLSTSYWPWLFPQPSVPQITVYCGEKSRAELPVLQEDRNITTVSFAPADELHPLCAVSENGNAWCSGDVNDIPEEKDGVYRICSSYGGNGTYFPQTDLHRTTSGTDEFYIEKNNPLSARVRHDSGTTYMRDGWKAEIKTSLMVRLDAEYYYVTTDVNIKENDTQIHSQHKEYRYLR